jgi:hypothetical protein
MRDIRWAMATLRAVVAKNTLVEEHSHYGSRGTRVFLSAGGMPSSQL